MNEKENICVKSKTGILSKLKNAVITELITTENESLYQFNIESSFYMFSAIKYPIEISQLLKNIIVNGEIIKVVDHKQLIYESSVYIETLYEIEGESILIAKNKMHHKEIIYLMIELLKLIIDITKNCEVYLDLNVQKLFCKEERIEMLLSATSKDTSTIPEAEVLSELNTSKVNAYNWGTTLYKLLANKDYTESLNAIELQSDTNKWVVELLHKVLEEDPKKRFGIEELKELIINSNERLHEDHIK